MDDLLQLKYLRGVYVCNVLKGTHYGGGAILHAHTEVSGFEFRLRLKLIQKNSL